MSASAGNITNDQLALIVGIASAAMSAVAALAALVTIGLMIAFRRDEEVPLLHFQVVPQFADDEKTVRLEGWWLESDVARQAVSDWWVTKLEVASPWGGGIAVQPPDIDARMFRSEKSVRWLINRAGTRGYALISDRVQLNRYFRAKHFETGRARLRVHLRRADGHRRQVVVPVTARPREQWPFDPEA